MSTVSPAVCRAPDAQAGSTGRLRACLRGWARPRRAIPACLFIGAWIGCLAGNRAVGLSWRAPSDADVLLCTAILTTLSLYARARRMPCLAEATFCLLLWFLYPLLGIRLSYLAVALGRPFVDPAIAGLDAQMGFDWSSLLAWELRHPALLPLQTVLYDSHIALALVSVAVFAYARPGQRNDELFFILFASLLAAIAIFAAYPTLGPASRIGIVAPHQVIIAAIRAHRVANLDSTGIISFPSYHTVMAIAFTYCHRGLPTFAPLAVWSAAMLATVPYGGDHQLADVAAGAALAAGVIALARLIYRPAA